MNTKSLYNVLHLLWRMFPTKLDRAFFVLFLFDAVVIGASYFFLAVPCGNAAPPFGFLYPFGRPDYTPAAIQMCRYMPPPLYYITVDLLITTLILYGASRALRPQAVKITAFYILIALTVSGMGSAVYYFEKLKTVDADLPAKAYKEGQIIVVFKEDATVEQAHNVVRSFQLTWEPHFPEPVVGAPNFNWELVRVPAGEEDRWIEAFQRKNIVKFAEPDAYIGGGP